MKHAITVLLNEHRRLKTMELEVKNDFPLFNTDVDTWRAQQRELRFEQIETQQALRALGYNGVF